MNPLGQGSRPDRGTDWILGSPPEQHRRCAGPRGKQTLVRRSPHPGEWSVLVNAVAARVIPARSFCAQAE